MQRSLLCEKFLCGEASSELTSDSDNGKGGLAGRGVVSKGNQQREECERSPNQTRRGEEVEGAEGGGEAYQQ